MATIWKGSLTFGLVQLPVELKPAVRRERLSFRQLHAEDLTPIRYERVSSSTGDVVPWGEIVKGYEYAKGKYVVLDDDELKAAALESSRTIDIVDFVPAGEVDWRFVETPYYLVPGKGGDKAYALLREAIGRSGTVGIGTIVMRSVQHLAAVHVVEDALVLDLLRFASELVEPSAYAFPSASLVRPQELKMAEQLVENLATPFEPGKYTDEHREALLRLIKAKLKGKKLTIEEPAASHDETQVIDLMARLKESLAGAKRPARKRPTAKAARRRKRA